jgi:hypothetical protein
LIPLQIPDHDYLGRIGLVVYLVAELEGLLKGDLVRFHPLLPPELDYGKPQGQTVTGMTTKQLGKYFIAHAPKSTDPAVAEYYRVGGEGLVEIAPKRNAMLHSQPGVDGYDPEQKLRLLRWKISVTNYEAPHMISDEWLDELIARIQVIRGELVARRPSPPPSSGNAVADD